MAALALPRPGERAAVTGCGTSLYMAQSYARLREDAAHGETDAFAASEFPDTRRYDRVVAITRSGTTTEVVRLLDSLRDAGVPATTVSAVEDSPAVGAAPESVILEFADERSVVQTRFATSALAILRSTLDEDVEPAAAAAEAVLAGDLPAADLSALDHMVFLGHGWTVGIANEAALKLREAAQVHTESYPAMEYRHGPVSLAGAGSLGVDRRFAGSRRRGRGARDRRHGPRAAAGPRPARRARPDPPRRGGARRRPWARPRPPAQPHALGGAVMTVRPPTTRRRCC